MIECNHSRFWKFRNTIIGTICLKCRYRDPSETEEISELKDYIILLKDEIKEKDKIINELKRNHEKK